VNPHEQQHLAGVLREYRERLERVRDELGSALDASGFPLDPLAGEILLVEARMLDVENFLGEDLRAAKRKRRSVRTRMHQITRARIGILRQHAPVALAVPAKYFTTEIPQPAPTISVVTPSFNQGRFLERTLYSVVSQHYPALEYVVQDGGSTDDTIEVLQRFDSLLAHWSSEPDGGQGDAINRGFARTSGDIMAYLNSDDLLLPGSLAYVARYFGAHPDVDVVYGHRVVIDELDRRVGSWVLPRHDSQELAYVDFVPQETLFWRRSAWEAAGGRIDSSMRFAIDWDLLLRMREAGSKMVRLPRFLGAFRSHAGQKTAMLHDDYLNETAALRRRVHGRGVSHDEATARAGPYMRRHVVRHLAYRARLRLPGRRLLVRTLPLEPWLRAPQKGGEATALLVETIAARDRAASVSRDALAK
jgi:glycosyltransferase involved in cell wall biosynthesis